jgi:hypothetical protein
MNGIKLRVADQRGLCGVHLRRLVSDGARRGRERDSVGLLALGGFSQDISDGPRGELDVEKSVIDQGSMDESANHSCSGGGDGGLVVRSREIPHLYRYCNRHCALSACRIWPLIATDVKSNGTRRQTSSCLQ